MTEAFCVKCKKKTEMKDAREVTMKNGKPAMKGQCAICGTTTQVFLSARGKQTYLDIKTDHALHSEVF